MSIQRVFKLRDFSLHSFISLSPESSDNRDNKIQGKNQAFVDDIGKIQT